MQYYGCRVMALSSPADATVYPQALTGVVNHTSSVVQTASVRETCRQHGLTTLTAEMALSHIGPSTRRTFYISQVGVIANPLASLNWCSAEAATDG